MARTFLPLIVPFVLAGSAHGAAITQGAPGAVPPEQFQIMTEREIAEHKAVMASLSGTARENYRNEQYRKLKERAQAQGYLLPDEPPWGRTEVVPASMAPARVESASPTEAVTLQRLIEEQKQVVEQAMRQAPTPPTSSVPAPTPSAPATVTGSSPHKATEVTAGKAGTETALPQIPDAQETVWQVQPASPAPVPESPAMPVTDQPTTSPLAMTENEATDESVSTEASSKAMQEYRNEMRRRFNDFMSQREARQQAEDEKRQQEKAAMENRRQQFSEDVARRRQAYRQRIQQPATQPAYPQAPSYAPQPYQPMMPAVPYAVPAAPYGYPAQPMVPYGMPAQPAPYAPAPR